MLTFQRTTIAFADDQANADAITTHHMEEAMFPGAGAQIYRNEAGEPVGWDYPGYDDGAYDPDDFDGYDDEDVPDDECPRCGGELASDGVCADDSCGDDEPEPVRYATLADAIDYGVKPALAGSGINFTDEQYQAIADQAYAYNPASGRIEQVMTTAEFWEIVYATDALANGRTPRATKDHEPCPTSPGRGSFCI